MSKHKRDKVELFVKVMLETLDAPAWRAMSHGPRSLYIALKRRHRLDTNNNGKIFLSQRQAVRELGSNRNYVARWFHELEYYGFIVMTRRGSLGIEGKGKAPHWRLTELGYKDDPPTRDFMKWNGKPLQVRKTRVWKSGTVVPWKSVTPKNKTLS
jgi:DNA-binding transcriptional MocR family regulator